MGIGFEQNNGWDRTVFEKAYIDIIECDFEFKIVYPAKMSRDKKRTGQVIIEKNEQTTTLNILLKIGDSTKTVTLFKNRNWFWYDIAYEMAKNTKWLDNYTFGIFSKKSDKFGYYSIPNDVIIGKLDFKETDIII